MHFERLLPFLLFLSMPAMAAADELDKSQPFEGRVHTYRIPIQYVPSDNSKLCGLKYYMFTRKISDARIEQVQLTEVANHPDTYKFHRRTHNGTAGSGVYYFVRLNSKKDAEYCVVTATAFAQSSYQQGLFGKFAVPSYDIEKELDEPFIPYEGEFDSPYPETSVRANFKRLTATDGSAPRYRAATYANTRTGASYDVLVNGQSIPVNLECFPYRNGTKCKYSSNVYGMLKDNVLDFGAAIKDIESAVTKIVQD